MKNTISLCMIVGNVEEYIRRCLTSFSPIADEICVVRAIGCQTPDRTLEIAEKEFGAQVAEYRNKPGHEDWPHVDDFAAARQMSFNMASGTYCFWCDSDDVLESGAEVVRELAERGEYAAYQFPYKIFGKGIELPRERMMLKESGRWQFAVHECFDFKLKPVAGAEDARVVVKHLPHLTKTGSNERNLRILRSIPKKEMTTGLLYHLHVELALAGDLDGSVAVAKEALAQPDIGRPEKYEIFLNLAAATESPEHKHALLLQAYGTDPCRREALSLLANNSLNFGRADFGLAYANHMMATPPPKFTPWNNRAALYGWVGEDIYLQALRANGHMQEADTLRKARMADRGGPTISLVHATRGRPKEAALARKTWLDMADDPARIEHIFAIDTDDDESDCLRRFHHVSVHPGGGCVRAWNYGCFATEAPVIVQLSDDWTPIPGWDTVILERLGDLNEPKVLAVNDGFRTDKLLCMSICTRVYWGLDYFLFHPWFKGMYCDNWFTELAYERGAVIEARDLTFLHNHPFKTGAPMDKTYAEHNSPERYAQGEAVIGELRKKRDWSTVPGFFNYWPFYQQIAELLKPGDTVVEVGSWMGRSITYLMQECQRLNKPVKGYTVDHFRGESNSREHAATLALIGSESVRPKFEENLTRCGVRDLVTVIEGDSAESAAQIEDKSLAFCFIDAAHDYESVKRDILAWQPKMKAGGILAGHDALWEDVEKAVRELLPQAQILGDVWMVK
jgi:cephalosporin hydroxylase